MMNCAISTPAGAPLTYYTADVAPTLESMLSGIKKDT